MKTAKTFSTSAPAAILAATAMLFAAEMSAKNLKLTVQLPSQMQGKVMLYIKGDTKPRYAMAEPQDGTATFEVKELNADTLNVYIFQDLNSNLDLDFATDGKPAEPCYRGTTLLTSDNTEQTIVLKDKH